MRTRKPFTFVFDEQWRRLCERGLISAVGKEPIPDHLYREMRWKSGSHIDGADFFAELFTIRALGAFRLAVYPRHECKRLVFLGFVGCDRVFDNGRDWKAALVEHGVVAEPEGETP